MILNNLNAQSISLDGFDTHVSYYTKNILLFAGKNPRDGNIKKPETGGITFSHSKDGIFMMIKPDVGYEGISGTFHGYIHSKSQDFIVFFFVISGEYKRVTYRRNTIVKITSYPMNIKHEVIYYLNRNT